MSVHKRHPVDTLRRNMWCLTGALCAATSVAAIWTAVYR